MSTRRAYGRMDTAWRLHDIGGPDLALRYLELSEESQRTSEPPARRPAPTVPATPRRSIVINGVRIGDDEVRSLERAMGLTVTDGEYWYDARCGMWGVKGGPCAGFARPGLTVGGPLQCDASRGNTGVFINGRELHTLDVMVMWRLGVVLPGRYWADAQGNFGLEGGPTLGNRFAARRATAGDPWT
jgi:hypothetical protein